MAICDYCRTALLEDAAWQRNTFKDHHTSTAQWVESIKQRCGICMLLAEQVARMPVKPWNSELQAPARPQFAFEQFELVNVITTIPLPLYRVRFHPRNIRGQVFLGFEAREDIALGNTGSTSAKLKNQHQLRQSFIAYASKDVLRDGPRRLSYKKPTSTGTDAAEVVQQLRSWLDTCNAKHKDCRLLEHPHRTLKEMPKRLIDCQDPVRLVRTEDIGYTGPYMTLSHCWGQEHRHPLTCIIENELELMEEIKMDKLPPTFQQAVKTVRNVGLRYIWIDSLCINQDKDKGDFNTEGNRMNDIYGGSHCNLAAVHAMDSQFGLYSEREPDDLEPFAISAIWEGYRRHYHLVRSDYWQGKLLSSVLYSRGWVFQERMLSPRIIHFTKAEVLWQCATVAASESYPDGLPPAINYIPNEECRLRAILGKLMTQPPDQRARAVLNSTWKAAAENYSQLALTQQKDRVIALSGLAKQVAKASGEQYHYGLWDFDFVDQLAWRSKNTGDQDCRPVQRYRDKDHAAPTWSWLSVVGPIEVRPRSLQGLTYELEILPDVASEEAGQTTVFTTKHELECRASLYDVAPEPQWFVLDDTEKRQTKVKLLLDESSSIWRQSSGEMQHLRCAMLYDQQDYETGMTNAAMIVLKQVRYRDTYERLGILEMTNLSPEDRRLLDIRKVPTLDGSDKHSIVLC